MKTSIALLSFLLSLGLSLRAQTPTAQEVPNEVRIAVDDYLQAYVLEGYRPHGAMNLDSLRADGELHELRVYPNEAFCSQPFTPQSVRQIYRSLQRLLPAPYNTYKLAVLNKKGVSIEELVPNIYRTGDYDRTRLWGEVDYDGQPWVENTSRPYRVTRGLQNRHLFIWPSHGRYFSGEVWKWQRPNLFCTTEDLLTQSFVFPYLLPMLERAGAVVATPRERDYQTQEAVVDNDTPDRQGHYAETVQADAVWETSADSLGFAAPEGLMHDSIFPFRLGTYRFAPAVSRRSRLATATWTPRLPAAGRYAVYVSYATRPNSVPDAHYTVIHRGGRTTFRVNQQMGGGTWVYLGTFDFDEGAGDRGRVILTNRSDHRGVVTADAVRFGGGVGRVERGSEGTSGLPSFLEAARYYAQWAGVPDTLVNTERGADDYRDDLRVRSNMLNYLGGGSCYQPGRAGQRVPFELALALHSDAGVRADGGVYGSLSISTTQDGDGRTFFGSGLSRQASSDFSQMLLSGLTSDLSRTFSTEWTRREHWDRNYAETRMPGVPSAILEMFSHQNFTDMKYAHDPTFKFALARSVYKTILRYVNYEHGVTDCVVQPLPPSAFSAELTADGEQVRLTWKATDDPLEKSARPTGYVVYTRMGDEGFDNGLAVGNVDEYLMPLTPGKPYAFRVAAVNEGGESFPSEMLSAYRSPQASARRVLIVNGFERLSGPARVETADSIGFDLDRDLGVPDGVATAFSGRQLCFDASAMGREGVDGLGYSGRELVGRKLAGNTFDYPLIHGAAVATAGYSYASCSREAFERGGFSLKGYAAVDYIAGLQGDFPHNLRPYRVFSPATQRKLTNYLKDGGALLVSGSYIGTDVLHHADDAAFAEEVLKYRPGGSARADSTDYVNGLNTQFLIYRKPNAAHYAAQAPDVLLPADGQAFTAFAYGGGQSAGTAYAGRNYRVIAMGFPFECIREEAVRKVAMKAILTFLTE